MLRNKSLLMAILLSVSSSLSAATLKVDFELPEFNVANYNAPYVAIWLEAKESKETLLLWHLKRADKDKWLVDIRRWWRKLGRYGETVDGITGATKGPGKYSETFQLPELQAFTFYIEVVREDGGRTLVKQAIDLTDSVNTYHFDPENELGGLTLTIGEK